MTIVNEYIRYNTKLNTSTTLKGNFHILDKELVKTFTFQLGEYFSIQDFIVKNDWLFVNMNNCKLYSGINAYNYPVNEHLESYTNFSNLTGKSFKKFIDENIYFEGNLPIVKKASIRKNLFIPQIF